MYHCLHCALQSFLLPPEGEANGTRITFCGHHLPFTITITLYFHEEDTTFLAIIIATKMCNWWVSVPYHHVITTNVIIGITININVTNVSLKNISIVITNKTIRRNSSGSSTTSTSAASRPPHPGRAQVIFLILYFSFVSEFFFVFLTSHLAGGWLRGGTARRA